MPCPAPGPAEAQCKSSGLHPCSGAQDAGPALLGRGSTGTARAGISSEGRGYLGSGSKLGLGMLIHPPNLAAASPVSLTQSWRRRLPSILVVLLQEPSLIFSPPHTSLGSHTLSSLCPQDPCILLAPVRFGPSRSLRPGRGAQLPRQKSRNNAGSARERPYVRLSFSPTRVCTLGASRLWHVRLGALQPTTRTRAPRTPLPPDPDGLAMGLTHP